jgi:hypothetical protein
VWQLQQSKIAGAYSSLASPSLCTRNKPGWEERPPGRNIRSFITFCLQLLCDSPSLTRKKRPRASIARSDSFLPLTEWGLKSTYLATTLLFSSDAEDHEVLPGQQLADILSRFGPSPDKKPTVFINCQLSTANSQLLAIRTKRCSATRGEGIGSGFLSPFNGVAL